MTDERKFKTLGGRATMTENYEGGFEIVETGDWDESAYDWDNDEWHDEDWDNDEDWDEWANTCSPSRCGDCWGGDGICMLEIEQLAAEQEDFEQHYMQRAVQCPHCGAVLTQYQIPTTQLWTWPGGFYSPMIALDIFAVYDAPKGEVHEPVTGRFYNLHHIWVGIGEHRRECLIMLALGEESALWP